MAIRLCAASLYPSRIREVSLVQIHHRLDRLDKSHGTRPMVKNETKHICVLKEEVTFYFDYRYLHLLLNASFKKNISS